MSDSNVNIQHIVPGETFIPIYGTVRESIVDGPGLRYTVFVQGCPHRCPGCHNPDSRPLEGGTMTDVYDLASSILSNPMITGATLSGGEPFLYGRELSVLARELKAHGLNIWVYSGFTYEELLSAAEGDADAHKLPDGEAVRCLLAEADVLVDGQFIEELKDIDLEWRGSSNQRIIELHSAMR